MSIEKLSKATERTIVQEYVNCTADKRILLLNTLLKKNADKKVLVLCSSASVVNFISELLGYFKLSVQTVNEKSSHAEQKGLFKTFSDEKESILLCTDNCVVPYDTLNLDWLIQFDPPSNFENYLKMLKSVKSKHALLFLQPSELSFLTQLKKKNISSNEFEVTWSRVSNITSEILKLTSKMYAVHMSANEAYRSFYRFYANHPMKRIFNVASLDLEKTSGSFGLRIIPFVEAVPVKKGVKRSIEEGEKGEAPLKKSKVRVIKTFKPVQPKKPRRVKKSTE